ncbi:MAG: hypothetical protein ACOCR1_01150 [Planctomycetota bacterium]
MEFLVRMKFWIGLAVAMIVTVVLFVVGPARGMRENADRLDELQGRADDLQGYAREGVKNEKWVQQQEALREAMEEQLDEIQEKFRERDAVLERFLRDPDSGEEGPLSFGRFPAAYDEQMDSLAEELENSVMVAESDDPLVRTELGSEWQPQPVLHGYEKQVWVQEAIVEAISEVNANATVVPVFISFEFKDEPDRYMAAAHEQEIFEVIPFELEVAMEFEFVTLFLRELMEADLAPELTTVQFSRYSLEGAEDGDRRAAARSRSSGNEMSGRLGNELDRDRKREEEDEDEEESEPVPDELVSVIIKGYIPDFIQPEEEEADEELEELEESEDPPDRRR